MIFLAAQRVDDRRLERVRELEHLIARIGAAGAAEQRDPLDAVEQFRELADLARRRQHGRRMHLGPVRRVLVIGRAQADVAGQHDDSDAALVDGGAHRDLQHARHLGGLRDQLAIVAAFAEQDGRMGLLEIAAADLGAGNLGGDREHRHAVAMAVEQTVDEMQVARPAAAGADRELAGHVRLGAGGERRHLLVAHVHPADAAGAQGFGEAVERIADDAPDAFDARGRERLHQLIRDPLGHGRPSTDVDHAAAQSPGSGAPSGLPHGPKQIVSAC